MQLNEERQKDALCLKYWLTAAGFHNSSLHKTRYGILKFPVFEDATVITSLIILQSMESPNLGNLLGQGFVYESLESFLRQDKPAIVFKIEDILKVENKDFYFLQESKSLDFVQRLQIGSKRLSDICDISTGVKPYEVGKGIPIQTAKAVADRVFDSSYKRDETYRRYLMGRDIDRYEIAPEDERWISYGKWLAAPRSFALYSEPTKIIVRRTADSIIAAYDSELFITLNNIYNLKMHHASLLKDMYILCVLNSKLATYYHQSQVDDKGRVFAEVKIIDLEKFPVRRITFTTPADERARLLEKAKNLYNYCLTKNDQSCVFGFVDHHLSKEPEESDVVHDLLTFLAEEMIRLNKEKRTAQKEFLAWLVTTLRILPDKDGRKGIDVLTGKSKLADYSGDYQKGESPLAFEELLDILRKNKGRLDVSLSDVGLVERVRKEYEGSLDRVLPMKERLAKTDALIDQVVYRLYGLTEEEFGVVEGKE